MGKSIKGNLGFIGGGQMAAALIKGLIAKGVFSRDQILASDPSGKRRDYLEENFGIKTFSGNKEVIANSDYILLAVKPQVMSIVLEDISPAIKKEHLIISIAAGIGTKVLENGLPEGSRVVRVMPNTPALVQAGAAALCGGTCASEDDIALVKGILEAVGTAVVVPEGLMDAVTGLSGSGPAYVFTFIEGLIDAGVREGLPRPVAQELAVQTVLGSAILLKESGKHPAELTSMVTSPGGTTIAGLYGLEKGGLRAAIMDGVRLATERSKELGG